MSIIAAKHDEVEVVILPGNHDKDAAKTLRVALSMFYGNMPRIAVAMDAGDFWYRRHGASLLGATHGHNMKLDQMPGVMANDRSADWGMSTFRYFFSGHVHHDRERDIAGVKCLSITTPAGRDAWAASHPWRASRSFTALAFSDTRGMVWREWVNVLSGPVAE